MVMPSANHLNYEQISRKSKKSNETVQKKFLQIFKLIQNN